MLSQVLLLLLVLSSILFFPNLAKKLEAKVSGRIYCYNHAIGQYEPWAGQEMQLWEKDSINSDDKLGTAKTNANGAFLVTGNENEIGSNEPYLFFTHNCYGKEMNSYICVEDTNVQQHLTIYVGNPNSDRVDGNGFHPPLKNYSTIQISPNQNIAAKITCKW